MKLAATISAVLALAAFAGRPAPDPSVPRDAAQDLLVSYWTADGNDHFENAIVMVDAETGVRASPKMHDAQGRVFGWPSDLIWIDGVLYGIESHRRLLYTVDPESGLCTPIGPPNAYAHVYSLAYDQAEDRLFGVDLKKKQLLLFDRASGAAIRVGENTLVGCPMIRALAYRDSERMLYAADDYTDRLIRIDPDTGRYEVARRLPAHDFARIEELSFHGDELYATLGLQDRSLSLVACQLQRLELDGPGVVDVGPLVDHCSPHALIVNRVERLSARGAPIEASARRER